MVPRSSMLMASRFLVAAILLSAVVDAGDSPTSGSGLRGSVEAQQRSAGGFGDEPHSGGSGQEGDGDGENEGRLGGPAGAPAALPWSELFREPRLVQGFAEFVASSYANAEAAEEDHTMVLASVPAGSGDERTATDSLRGSVDEKAPVAKASESSESDAGESSPVNAPPLEDEPAEDASTARADDDVATFWQGVFSREGSARDFAAWVQQLGDAGRLEWEREVSGAAAPKFGGRWPTMWQQFWGISSGPRSSAWSSLPTASSGWGVAHVEHGEGPGPRSSQSVPEAAGGPGKPQPGAKSTSGTGAATATATGGLPSTGWSWGFLSEGAGEESRSP